MGFIPLGYAAFRLGRGATLGEPPVLVAGIVGLVCAAYWGILGGLIVGAGCYLVGRGTRVSEGRSVVLVLMGIGLLAIPLLLMGLFYMASLNT